MSLWQNKQLFVIFGHNMLFRLSLLIISALLVGACNRTGGKKWAALPESTSISHFSKTEFVPALESRIAGDKNVIYASAFLMAWDKVKKQLKSPVVLTETNSGHFTDINTSKSYKNTLAKNEYEAEALVNDGIIARAFFNKTLPFQIKLNKSEHPISFNETKVAAFGLSGYDIDAIRFTEILYYNDDDHFIISLTPKNDKHRIVLVKGLQNNDNLLGAFTQINKLIDKGKTESRLPEFNWKYQIHEDDIISIPEIRFNIESRFPKIEGQRFKTGKRKHTVISAIQRTGFIMNENGAVAETSVRIAVDSISGINHKPIPRKMFLNKPFYIFLKRTDCDYPYFMLFIQNAELLIKK